MAKATRDIMKSKRPSGTGEPVLVRLQPPLAHAIDKWRRDSEDMPSRAEAIRRLVELGLKVKANSKKTIA